MHGRDLYAMELMRARLREAENERLVRAAMAGDSRDALDVLRSALGRLGGARVRKTRKTGENGCVARPTGA